MQDWEGTKARLTNVVRSVGASMPVRRALKDDEAARVEARLGAPLISPPDQPIAVARDLTDVEADESEPRQADDRPSAIRRTGQNAFDAIRFTKELFWDEGRALARETRQRLQVWGIRGRRTEAASRIVEDREQELAIAVNKLEAELRIRSLPIAEREAAIDRLPPAVQPRFREARKAVGEFGGKVDHLVAEKMGYRLLKIFGSTQMLGFATMLAGAAAKDPNWLIMGMAIAGTSGMVRATWAEGRTARGRSVPQLLSPPNIREGEGWKEKFSRTREKLSGPNLLVQTLVGLQTRIGRREAAKDWAAISDLANPESTAGEEALTPEVRWFKGEITSVTSDDSSLETNLDLALGVTQRALNVVRFLGETTTASSERTLVVQANLTRECYDIAVEILQSARGRATAAENTEEENAEAALQDVEQLVLATDVLVHQMALTKRRIRNEDKWIREARILGALPGGLTRGLLGYYAGGLAALGGQNALTGLYNFFNGGKIGIPKIDLPTT